jgi:hypothetical protein
MKSKKQRKADKAFIKKIGSLTMGGKAVGKSNGGCPVCGKKGSHGHHVHLNVGPAVDMPEPATTPPRDDSQEQSLCN